MRPIRIKSESGRVLAGQAWEAETWAERGRGWLGKPAASPGEALLLRARSIHTLGMRFSLDLAFLDAQGRVLRLRPELRPNRIALGPFFGLGRGLHYALELPAGRLAACAIRPGEFLDIQAGHEVKADV